MKNWDFYNCTTAEDWRNLLLGWVSSPHYHGGFDEELERTERKLKNKGKKKKSNVISFEKYFNNKPGRSRE